MIRHNIARATWSALVATLLLFLASPAFAHCDGVDGPVVKAAEKALETKNVALVLIWVRVEDEPEIRSAFAHTLAVRALSTDARELADRYFFETLVRVHRAGEGAPYTGLQPSGRDLGPAIPAADKALDDGSAEPLVQLLMRAMQGAVRDHLEEALRAKAFASDDVAAGRVFVKNYVEFIHYVERLHEAITATASGHFAETEQARIEK